MLQNQAEVLDGRQAEFLLERCYDILWTRGIVEEERRIQVSEFNYAKMVCWNRREELTEEETGTGVGVGAGKIQSEH